MDNLTHIAIFMGVVECGSFTAAAHKLGMSKPTVSKHITTLERHLGARLLNRTTRSIGLTEIGTNFYGHCRNIMTELETAESEVLQSSSAPRGRLRITAPNCFGDQRLAPALPEFLDMYPDVEIDLTLENRFVDLIKEGLDLAIRNTRNAPTNHGFRYLAPFVRIVCAGPVYCERHGRPVTALDLVNHNCLVNPCFATSDTWQLSGPNGVETVKVAGRFRADDGGALHMALLSGHGLALMPMFLVGEDLAAGRLCNALPAYEENSFSIFAVYPDAGRIAPKVGVFIDYLEAQLGATSKGECSILLPDEAAPALA